MGILQFGDEEGLIKIICWIDYDIVSRKTILCLKLPVVAVTILYEHVVLCDVVKLNQQGINKAQRTIPPKFIASKLFNY